jgi:hypothetical protein
LHGIVCSAATSILARLNIFYVMINGKFSCRHPCASYTDFAQWAPLSLLLFLFLYFPTGRGHQRQMRSPCSKMLRVGAAVSCYTADSWRIFTFRRWLGLYVGFHCSDVDFDRL